jgi:peptidoglycan hydrolase-like protein with peptidoglycan-binding domain
MRFWIVSVKKLPLGTRVLRIGAKGDDVKTLQELLVKHGCYFGKSDGVFGPLTQEAVRLMQRTFKLRVDGIAGNEVVAALKNQQNYS